MTNAPIFLFFYYFMKIGFIFLFGFAIYKELHFFLRRRQDFLKRNDMSTTFLQQILSSRLLLVVIVRAKSNLSVRFGFEPIITNHL